MYLHRKILVKLVGIIFVFFAILILFNYFFIPKSIHFYVANSFHQKKEFLYYLTNKKISKFILNNKDNYCDMPYLNDNGLSIVGRNSALVFMINAYFESSDFVFIINALEDLKKAISICDVNIQPTPTDFTPVNLSVLWADSDIFKLIIENGGDVKNKINMPGKIYDGMDSRGFLDYLKSNYPFNKKELLEVMEIEKYFDQNN